MERHRVKCLICGKLFWIDIRPDIQLEVIPDGDAFRWYCPHCVKFSYVEFSDVEPPPPSPPKP